MLYEIFPFQFKLDTVIVAGACLWALSLYLGLSALRTLIIELFDRWFNFAERFLYTSQEEFDKTRQARESQNAFYASIFSIIPFLLLGSLCSYGVQISLGRSWAISLGILACMSCGIYALGRQSEDRR